MIGDRQAKTLRVGMLSPLEHLDPRESQDFQSGLVLWQVYETPYAPPFGDEQPEPVLFTDRLREVTGSRGTQYVAEVRTGIRFSDGTLLTADGVARALMGARAFTEQASARAEGERVLFELTRPNARFEVVLTQRYCAVLKETSAGPIGTGPYVLAADSTPERVHLVANPHHRTDADIEEIVVSTYPADDEGRPVRLLEAVQSGEVDFTNALSREDLGRLRGVRKWFEPGCSTAILFFNTEREYLASAETRRALALAISRTQVARLSYSNALAFKAAGVLPPMMGNWRDGIRSDLPKARELFAEVGRQVPRSLVLRTVWAPRPYLPHPRSAGESLAVQWKELGVDVSVRLARSAEDHFDRLLKGEYDLLLAGWIADTPDPADFLESTLHSELIPVRGKPITNRANMSRYRSAEMDEALAAFRAEPSRDHRTAVFDLLRRDMPFFPLMYGPNVVAHSWRVRRVRLSPLGIPFFATMSL